MPSGPAPSHQFFQVGGAAVVAAVSVVVAGETERRPGRRSPFLSTRSRRSLTVPALARPGAGRRAVTIAGSVSGVIFQGSPDARSSHPSYAAAAQPVAGRFRFRTEPVLDLAPASYP